MKKLILITGASRGIGAATALLAAQQGYTVVLNYRSDHQAAEAVAAGIADAGGESVLVAADVSTSAGVNELFDRVDDIALPLTTFVNNAGLVGLAMPFTEYTDERLRQTLALNVFGAFACAREAIKRMLSHDHPSAVINVSSAAARIGSPGEFIDYAASKGAIDTMTLGLAKEFGARGIRVNAVRPGIIKTDIHAAAGVPERVEKLAPTVPLARAGEAEEVASTILWLASAEAAYVTGALLDVAGGR